jgi:hypothetical protein
MHRAPVALGAEATETDCGVSMIGVSDLVAVALVRA